MDVYSERTRRYTPPYDDHYHYDEHVKSMNSEPHRWNHSRVDSLGDAWVHVPPASSPRNYPHPPPPVPQPPPLPPQQQQQHQYHHHSLPVHASPPRNPYRRSSHDVDVTFEQNIRYSPQRGSVSRDPNAYRNGYPSPVSLPSHTRSFSHSRPGSSHASDSLPVAPPPPPLSFLSHVRHQRRRSSNTKESQKQTQRKNKQWPPEGYSNRDVLSQKEAQRLIGKGASTFKGITEGVRHAAEGHNKFFAVMEQESAIRTDRAPFLDPAFEAMDLSLEQTGHSVFPWMSLEQPSTTTAYGKSPGTTTLNYYVGKSGSLRPLVNFGSKVKPRKMKLIAILDRLQELQMQGLNDVEEFEHTYNFLYDKLIEDPDWNQCPHYDRALQIADLITVLSNPDWTDFSLPREQVVAKYFDSHDQKQKRKFFHQLLLAVELYLRIESPDHEAKAKSTLLAELPPKVTWDLALARRWLENMRIERTQDSAQQSTFSFTLASKKKQKEALRVFAKALKWPNLDELEYILEEQDEHEKSIEDRSADAMSWFTGVILPGVTLPWLLMNTLIDCDRDTGDELNTLTHIHPNSGFQYRANTYWSSSCIVGKVLGANRGVKQVAGWIGPCIFAPKLNREQCVVVRQLDPLDAQLSLHDMETMLERTSPLGEESTEYPLEDYDMIAPDPNDVEDIIRIQELRFEKRSKEDRGGNRVHDAYIVFAFFGKNQPMHLKYNVDFINAFPCANGPHPLYYGYKHRLVRVDEGLVGIENWASRNVVGRSARRSRTSSPAYHSRSASPLPIPGVPPRAPSLPRDNSHALLRLRDDLHNRSRSVSPASSAWKGIHEVLVISAFGVSDNEVFARAWCATQGVSAIVANVRETCVACAVREAYAACVSVVILTEGGSGKEEDSLPKRRDVLDEDDE